MLCLAREPPPGPQDEQKAPAVPSSVYISYDNGNTFEDKTGLFQLKINNGTVKINSTLDQFITHPEYNTVSGYPISFSGTLDLF